MPRRRAASNTNITMTPESDLELARQAMAQAHQRWLRDPGTQMFFESLKNRLHQTMCRAAEKAVIVAIDWKETHNRNVRAAELIEIIKTYGNPSKCPYEPNPVGTPDSAPSAPSIG